MYSKCVHEYGYSVCGMTSVLSDDFDFRFFKLHTEIHLQASKGPCKAVLSMLKILLLQEANLQLMLQVI